MNLNFLKFLYFSFFFLIPFFSMSAQSPDFRYVGGLRIEKNDSVQQKELGKPFTKFSLENLNGKIVSEKDLFGKVTFMNFWFLACPPCIAELEDLNNLFESFKDNSAFHFLSITFDPPESVKQSINKYNLTHPVYTTSKDQCRKLNLNQSFPTTIIFDKKGNVRFVKTGGAIDKEGVVSQIDKIKQEILALLSE